MTSTIIPFNSSLETGVRSLAILTAAYPASYDLQRLVELDYLVVHSGDAGGPDSLHAPLPLRVGELLVRRELIEKGLLLMMSRGLIRRRIRPEGMEYEASDNAAPYLSALQEDYAVMLLHRANWVIEAFGQMTTEAIRAINLSFLQQWSTEFQSREIPGSA